MNGLPRCLLLFLAAIFMMPAAVSAEGSLQARFQAFQERYRSLKGLEIPYERLVTTASMAMLGQDVSGDAASGTIFFAPPDRLKLVQEQPAPEIILADGEYLWWYVPAQKKVQRYAPDAFGREMGLLSGLLGGLARIEQDFEVVLTAEPAPENLRIELRPLDPHADIERLVVDLDAASDIRELLIVNPLGSKTRFRFAPPKEVRGFGPHFFEFKVPPGVELVPVE